MAVFIMTGKYSAEALKEISGQRTAEAIEIYRQCGGRLLAAYVTMGDADLVAIVELPGVSEAIKASVALSKAFGISFSTVPALPIEDFDKLVGGEPALQGWV
jgi:uncharacterized protein with GYD domain